LNVPEERPRVDEQLVRLVAAASIGLRTDDPTLVLGADDIVNAAGQEPRHVADTIAALYASSNWLWGRLTLLDAIAHEPIGDCAMGILALLGRDGALSDFHRQFAHAIADDLTYRRQHPLLDDPQAAGMHLLVLADEVDVDTIVGWHLWQRPDLTGGLRALALLNTTQEVLVEGTYSLIEVPGAIQLLGSVEHATGFVSHLRAAGAAERFGDRLVELRPTDSASVDGCLELIDVLLQYTAWRPRPRALSDFLHHSSATSPPEGAQEAMPVAQLLLGAAVGSVDLDRPRAAALWSLASLAEEPTVAALSRLIHESCTANDVALLREALNLEIPAIPESLGVDAAEDLLSALMRAHMSLGHQADCRQRIVQLVAATVRRSSHREIAKTETYRELQRELEREAVSETPISESENALFAAALLGAKYELARNFPHAESDDFERDGDRYYVLGASALWKRASQMAYTRRVGPHGLLHLADCAIEIGDLVTAYNFVTDAEGAYPRTVPVLVARIKLSVAAARMSETRRYVTDLIDQLRYHREDAAAGDIARALLSLPSWFLHVAPDVVEACLNDSRLAEVRPRIKARLADA
jgi:hypothetical protein